MYNNSFLLNLSKSIDEELIVEGKGGFNVYISYFENNLDFLNEKDNKSILLGINYFIKIKPTEN